MCCCGASRIFSSFSFQYVFVFFACMCSCFFFFFRSLCVYSVSCDNSTMPHKQVRSQEPPAIKTRKTAENTRQKTGRIDECPCEKALFYKSSLRGSHVRQHVSDTFTFRLVSHSSLGLNWQSIWEDPWFSSTRDDRRGHPTTVTNMSLWT